MKPRLQSADHVVVSIAGKEGRDPLDIVGVPGAEESLVEFHELLSF
jgi:hypothetical protein